MPKLIIDLGDDDRNAALERRIASKERSVARERLEYLRSQLDAECISMGELIELQGLAEHIEPGDVQLAEAAGIDEQEFASRS